MADLVLGPLLRYVDHTSATIWVETDDTCTVHVEADERSWSASTFAVHGHHYALVEVEGLEPGTIAPYAVTLEGHRRREPGLAPATARTSTSHRR